MSENRMQTAFMHSNGDGCHETKAQVHLATKSAAEATVDQN